MFSFSNAQLYRLGADHTLTALAIEAALAKKPFVPCEPSALSSCGFVALARHQTDTLSIAGQNTVLICLRVEEKLLPSAVVMAEANTRIEKIEYEEKRRIGRKEAKDIKERAGEELRVKAFVKQSSIRALIDFEQGLIIVDAAAPAKAEFFLSMLREAIGSLPTRLVRTNMTPSTAMTMWVSDGAPLPFSLGNAVNLIAPGTDGAQARFKNQALVSDEVRQNLDAGKVVTRLALEFNDRMAFSLGDGMEVTGLAMLDILKEEARGLEADTQEDLFASELALMIGEFRQFIPALLEVLGGELAP